MIYLKLLKSLLLHKWLVLRAGLMIGGIPLWRLIIHDWSKFSPAEFFRYARYKYSDGGREEWAMGWLHHLHSEDHHPEYWIILWHGDPDFYSGIGGQDIAEYVSILPMPEVAVREMLADMHGTSKQMTGSWDISNWLNSNGPKIHFHDGTITLLDKVMKEIGYDTVNFDWSWKATLKFDRLVGQWPPEALK